MEHEILRSQVKDFQQLGEAIVKYVKRMEEGRTEASKISDLLDQFIALIDETILRSEASAKIYSGAVSSLNQFCKIISPSIEIDGILKKHKENIADQIKQKSDGLVEFAKPYELFVSLVENPDMDISEDESDLIGEVFGHRITRPLYQGKFVISSEEHIVETYDSPPQELQQALAVTGDLTEKTDKNQQYAREHISTTKFIIKTEKENSTFSTKSFASEYTHPGARSRGVIVINSSRRGELILLHSFARLGALTRRQLSTYVFNEEISELSFNRILKNGFVSSIKFDDLEVEFFALSERGSEVFKREKSRQVINRVRSLPSEAWNYARSISQIENNMIAYERVVTTALYLLNIDFDGVTSVTAEQIDLDHQNAVIHVELLYMQDEADKSHSLVLFSDGEMVAIAVTDINSLLEDKRVGPISEQMKDIATKMYYSEVSSDGVSVEFQGLDGATIEFETLLAGLLMQSEYNEGDNNVGQPSYLELQDESAADTADANEYVIDSDMEQHERSNPFVSADTATDTVSDEEKTGYSHEIADHIYTSNAIEFDMTEDDEPHSIAKKLLNEGLEPIERAPFDVLVRALLRKSVQEEKGKTDYLGRAVLLLKALALANSAIYEDDYKCLLLATDLRFDSKSYTCEEILTLFSGKNEGTAMHFAALLRALFHPDSEYDYFSLIPYADGILKNFDNTFKSLIGLKQTLSSFLEINTTLRRGFTDKVTTRFVSEQSKNEMLKQMTEEASRFKAPPHISQRVNGVPQMLSECFGETSLLGMCMKIISSSEIKERDDVQAIYLEFTEADKVSEAKVLSIFEDSWRKIRTRHMVPDIVGIARDKIINAFYERLELIEHWLNCTDNETDADASNANQITSKIQKALRDALEIINNEPTINWVDKAILHRMFSSLLARLDGVDSTGLMLEDWLSGGILPLKSGIPVISREYSNIRYYEPWRNVLRHIQQEPQELQRILQRIETPDDPLYDNLGQAILVCDYLKEPERAELYRKSIPNAHRAAEVNIKAFMAGLEIDYAYGRVDEPTKEMVLGAFDSLKQELLDASNFAQLRFFIDALRSILNREVERNHAIWSSIITERRERGTNELLDRAERFLQSENANFILVEEALNNFDSNVDADPGAPISEEENLFAAFTAPANFDELLRFCRDMKRKSFRAHAPVYVGDKVEKAGLSVQYANSARTLAMSLPESPQVDGANDIKRMLEELGFNVARVMRENSNSSPARFTATMTPDARNRANYNHPIAEMGTRITTEFNVVELFGSVEPESIISEVRKVDSRHMPIILLNGSLTLAQRRQLAKLFLKYGKASNPFILLDWVLLLHLAVKVRDDRLRTMLACSLPYTGTKQLFSRTSTSPISDEMYIGRSVEMSQILDMNGPVIVYGGRQLGKTALLQRAKNRFHIPARNDFSVFIDAKNCADEKSFVALACKELGEVGVKISRANSIAGICDNLRAWFKPGNRRLLMLIDESDKLLSKLAAVDNYAPLTPLENLCRVANGNFKFVFAGLHNVFLAAKETNTIFGHFGNPLCIKPMSHSDAYKLLARPLSYLGFSVNPDMLLRLLVNTNFYPGVVHFVGAELIDMLMNKYAEHFSDKNNPPYELTERQIGAIMSSAALTSCIEERIRMTLEVDQSYLMIARCIALLYHLEEEKRGHGYTPEEILDCAADLEVTDLVNMGKDKCVHLLSELCDMSILVETEGLYRFRQLRFLNIIGKSGEEIMEQMSSREASDDE